MLKKYFERIEPKYRLTAIYGNILIITLITSFILGLIGYGKISVYIGAIAIACVVIIVLNAIFSAIIAVILGED